MSTYQTGEIRRELATLNGGSICHETWKKIRSAAQVTGHKCSFDQWVRLCAGFAIYKRGRVVTVQAINKFIRDEGGDPMAFMPGLLPVGIPDQIPGECTGRDLANVLFQWIGLERSEDSISIYCRKAGLEYGRDLPFSKDKILAIVYECARSRSQKRLKALENLKKAQKAQGVKRAA